MAQPDETTASHALCQRCGRPKATAADQIRWRSGAALSEDERAICWTGCENLLTVEEEDADAATLREALRFTRGELAALNCKLNRIHAGLHILLDEEEDADGEVQEGP